MQNQKLKEPHQKNKRLELYLELSPMELISYSSCQLGNDDRALQRCRWLPWWHFAKSDSERPPPTVCVSKVRSLPVPSRCNQLTNVSKVETNAGCAGIPSDECVTDLLGILIFTWNAPSLYHVQFLTAAGSKRGRLHQMRKLSLFECLVIR